MKVPLKWLSEYVSCDWTPERVAERLTMAGVEVSSLERIGELWDNVSVALVTAVQPHPNADRLRLVTVDLGGESATVVCGAPNVATGQKVAFAKVGARLIDGHTGETAVLKPAKIRGVVSAGMVCSEKELGLSEDHTGTVELPADAPIGVPLQDYLGDVVLDLELTPNRPDCLSVVGVAREVAAIAGVPVRLPDVSYETCNIPVESLIGITIENPSDCRRYCSTVVRGVKLGPSPSWMQARLKACGMRPISNVVDITNYVMLELGQPLHAFDYDTIAGHQIVVRRARPGEVFKTLDGVDRLLSSDVLMIADGERAIGIAGIMGGSNTEVSETTSAILVEAATFSHATIRHGSSFLGLKTEASLRFDKILHPDLAAVAVRRAAQMLVTLCGGTAMKGVYDAYPAVAAAREISLPRDEVKRLTGVDVEERQARTTLELLGYEWKRSDATASTYAVPYWRGDATGPADLVEDVVRIMGYDRIPTGAPRFTSGTVTVPGDLWPFKSMLRGLVAGAGYQEVLTYSLVNRDRLVQAAPGVVSLGEPLRVANPMSRDMECLRTSLRASLVDVLARNRRRGQTAVRMFELSRVYVPRGRDLPEERETLCALLCGIAEPLSWHHGERQLDFYDAKGLVEYLCDKCRITPAFVPGSDPGLFPGRQADVLVDDQKIGVVGQLHPAVARACELDSDVMVVELDVARLMARAKTLAEYEPLYRFPFSERDLAIVVDRNVTFDSVREIVSGFALVADASLFDLYAGEQIPAGKKSFAMHLVFQAPDRTLTDAEVNQVQEKLLSRLASSLGATLRS